MTEGKAEYLQMIQEPISRMSTASAIFKGFAATIVSGIAALTYCDVHPTVLALSFVPVLLFALLDRAGKVEIYVKAVYDRPTDNKSAKSRVWDCVKSPSIWLFYPAMIGILVAVYILKLKGVLL